MAVYANNTLTNTINVAYDMALLKARYATAVIMPRVLNKSGLVSKSGETINIEIEPTFTTGAVTAATGAFTPTNVAPTQAIITVNQWRYASVEITEQAAQQSFYNPIDSFATPAGKALAIDEDSDLAALYSSVVAANDINGNANPQSFDDTLAREAMLRLADSNVPLEGLSWVLPPIAFWKGWLAQPNLTPAYASGLGKSMLITGQMSEILGVPAFQSTVISTVNVGGVSLRKGMLLHKESLGIATQLNHSYKTASRVSNLFLSDVAVVAHLYGTQVIRDNHYAVVTLHNS